MAESRPHIGAALGILLFLAAVVLAMLETGSAPAWTPPGPDVAAGSINGAGYVFHRWPSGRSVFLWHDLPTAVTGHGSGSTTDDVYTYAGRAGEGPDRMFDWEALTRDGQAITLRIAEETFTLTEDAVFFVRAGLDQPEIWQAVGDLTRFAADHQGALAMVDQVPNVASFVAESRKAAGEGTAVATTAQAPDLRTFAGVLGPTQAVLCPDLVR